jgi:stage II sporulation protein AB (anti-sigma F factor)
MDKKSDNFMSLKFEALQKNESFARSVAAAFCTSVNPTVDQINDIKTAVSEAVTNSIVHGYNDNGGLVEIRASLSGRTVHIEILDDGVGIDDIARARQPFFTTKPESERSGMGFTVMETFMDTLEVLKRKSGGLCVKMTKNFDMNQKAEERTIA